MSNSGVSLPDPTTDPAGYVLAVADLREQRAKAATTPRWAVDPHPLAVGRYCHDVVAGQEWIAHIDRGPDAEHIAAEANPDHALTEVALWRGIAERHHETGPSSASHWCAACKFGTYRCPDLLAVVAAAKSYAGDTTHSETRPGKAER